MKPIILAFSGSIASGKSTLSNTIAERFCWPRVSFGEYVRSIARLRSLPEGREVLQKIGAELVEENIEQFCRAVLAQVDWKRGQSLIIDGVRHIEVLTTLRQLVEPMKIYLIFIIVDEAIRVSRLREREQNDSLEYDSLELSSTEEQVTKTLKDAADLIINSAHPLEASTKEVISWLLSHDH